ncbi:ribonuclease III [Microvirga thermotolerans]|uniref:Ribonuclease 3 n=1 Tax=Microvirga thermotolerans TaxID=2651334 RepID=A0A5P9JUV9_9HYPH|nr:ribonuclease III [Microvirga thermotolerans]QFU16612.1 ribonuclease III [Microvirga thermotolerans]
MARRTPLPDRLQETLGYRFERPELLAEALTHVSAPGAGGQSYQRLEFLGDRVLGLIVAEMLYREFPRSPEGELSRRLAELVRRESCAEVAMAWDVGPYLKLGAGEAQSGERRNLTILADVCEAIIGAVFLDGGYAAARALVEASFKDLLHAPRRPLRDPKSALQEWAQGKGLPPPTYAVVEQTGPDHAPKFRVSVKVKGHDSDFGLGSSKRAAEQEAARSLLLREGVWTEDDTDNG